MAAYSGKLVVKSEDPRINYNLLPGEILKTCPYNPSHAILPIKFSKHVLNCHRLHCKEQQKNGEGPLFGICQYDRSHHVYKELLANHEENCDARVLHGLTDDLGWDRELGDGNVVSSEKSLDCGQTVAPEVVANKVSVKEPPPATLAKMHSENWEDDTPYERRFDAEKRISYLRSTGYSLVKTIPPGLSKSEKKAFYDKDAAVKAAHKAEFKQHAFVKRVQDKNAARRKSSLSSGAEDELMFPINEEQ